MKKAILEDDTLTLEEKEEKLINQYLLIGWTAINAILFVSYFIECIKGTRTIGYYLTFCAIIWIPELIIFIMYKLKPQSSLLKYAIVLGYMVMYTFVMVTGNTILVFTYILPLLSLMTLYHNKKLILYMGIAAVAFNGAFIALWFFRGDIALNNSRDYEIQIALLFLCFGGCYLASGVYENINKTNHRYMKKLNDNSEQIKKITMQSITAIVNTIDAKDEYTKGHSQRVAEYSYLIAKELGLSENDAEEIRYVALLHDIGKIAIPDSILNKAGRLTDEEYGIMKTHPLEGSRILSGIELMPGLDVGAKYHHERYDGKGYPCGLKGEEIPFVARIICIADSYDAMSSSRVYRRRLSDEDILNEFERCIGTQFDPEIGSIFISMLKDKKVKFKESTS